MSTWQRFSYALIWVASIVLLHQGTLLWLVDRLSRPSCHLNALLFATSLALLLYRFRRQVGGTQRREWPMLFYCGGVALSLFAGSQPALRNYLALLGLATMLYGASGFFLDRRAWFQLLAPSALLLSTLPLSEFIDIYLGFPLRRLQSDAIAGLFAGFSGGQLEGATLLRFENGLASIDLPCSGVKSLWTGAMMCLALTWYSGRRLGIRWLLASLTFALTLLLANAARITLLALIGFVLDAPRIAEFVHIPLGLAGFIGCCVFYFWTLNCWIPSLDSKGQSVSTRSYSFAPVHACAAFTVATLCFGPSVSTPAFASDTALRVSLDGAEPRALRPIEERHFGAFPNVDARKWTLGNTTVLTVYSSDFRAHHHPERCFGEAGFDVSRADTIAVSPGLVATRLGGSNATPRGYYWFQNASRSTADYADRVFSGVTGKENRWVLVSALSHADPEADLELLQDLHRAVANAFNERDTP